MSFTCCWALYGLGLYLVYKVLDWIVRLPRIGHLDQRYFFITGCDTGFGHAIAKKLDKQGCHVFAACLTEKGETELKKSCSNRLTTLHLDVTSHGSVLKAYQLVKDKLPANKGLSGILNNAGIAQGLGPSDWLQLKDYEKTMSVNLLGLIDVTTTFLSLVKKARGRVVNTASMAGRYSLPNTVPYCISKYGVEAFSDALRREMRPFKVGVHLIEPGYHKTSIVDTESLIQMFTASWTQTEQEIKDQYGQNYIDNLLAVVRRNTQDDRITTDISGVVDAYDHALTGLFPRARYVVGFDAKYIYLMLQRLPEWLGDWIFDKMNHHSGLIPPCGAQK